MSDDDIDWTEVAWADRELQGDTACCDSRDHFGGASCPCPQHPQSYLHPSGTHPWPAP